MPSQKNPSREKRIAEMLKAAFTPADTSELSEAQKKTLHSGSGNLEFPDDLDLDDPQKFQEALVEAMRKQTDAYPMWDNSKTATREQKARVGGLHNSIMLLL